MLMSRLITATRHILSGCALMWGGIVNAFLIGNRITPTLPTIATLNQLAPWIASGSFLVFALAFTLRAPIRIAAWLVPGAIAFVWWFAPAWWPKPQPQTEGITITATTHNILGGLADFEQIVNLIRTVDADIVALQEVRENQGELFLAQLGDIYPYQAAWVTLEDGVVLLSRYPILSFETAIVDGTSGRHLCAEIEIAGQQLHAVEAQLRNFVKLFLERYAQPQEVC